MAENKMDKRPLWKTKTFYVALLTIGAGVVAGAFDGWDQAIDKVLAGLAMIAGRDALSKLED